MIIPLELPHGQAERCLRGWIHGQTYPRELYEVLAVAPDDAPARELRTWDSLLTERDRLLRGAGGHDMALYTAGARAANGRVLLFTESHCWPTPEALDTAEQVLGLHPDWAGFSGRSVRSTHNRLSVVEADLYEADVAETVRRHPWCTVLDHAFVVHRDLFLRLGGFDCELGHFAEWELAARFHRHGATLGYVPESLVHHYYGGELGVWKDFTEDFVDGQMRFLERRDGDPCAELFSEVPEWSVRGDWRRATAGRMLGLIWQDWQRRRRGGATGPRPGREVVSALGRWVPAAAMGARPPWLRAQWRARRARWRLAWALRFRSREHLRVAMRGYWAAVIHCRRLRWVLSAAAVPDRVATDRDPLQETGAWEPDRVMRLPAAGFHLAERWLGQPCRWSEPAAMIQLPLRAGRYSIGVEWLPVRPWTRPPQPCFYFNEQPVGEDRISREAHRVTLSVSVPRDAAARLAWVCRSWKAPHDARPLGLLMRRLTWLREPPQ